MMCVGNVLLIKETRERLLHGERRGACLWHKPQPMTDTEDVGIDCHTRFAPDDAQYDVGSLAAHAGQFCQLLHVLRHFALVFLPKHPCHFHQVFCLAVGVGDGAYVVVDNFGTGQGHRLGVRIVLEEAWRDLIDALVGALGTSNWKGLS